MSDRDGWRDSLADAHLEGYLEAMSDEDTEAGDEEGAPAQGTPRKQTFSAKRHPFLAGRKHRQDELGDVTVTSAHWRWTVWLLILGYLVAGAGLAIREILRPAVKVVIVQVDEWSNTKVLGEAPENYLVTKGVLEKEARLFVEILRRIPEDKVLMGDDWSVEKGIWGRVTEDGGKLLNHYLMEHGNPLQKRGFVKVEVSRVLPKGKNSLDVSWTEKHFTEHKQPKDEEPQRWSGIFSYQQRPPQTLGEAWNNPHGIWWHDWSFSRER